MNQKVYKSGSSLVVVVPSEFVDNMGIKSGDSVQVKVNYERGMVHYSFSTRKQLSFMGTLTNVHSL